MDCSYLSLKDKVAVITGACRGIGKEIAMIFADAGADLAISCRKQSHIEETAEEIKKRGNKVLPVAAHSRKSEELQNFYETVKNEFGHIDILVNNAATSPGMGEVIDMDERMYDQIMNTNLKAYTVLSQLAARLMIEQGGGNIINISSIGGIRPDKGLGLYGVSKAGVNMLTKVMASELGQYNIRVNAIAPGVAKTKFSEPIWSSEAFQKERVAQTPLRRIALPEDIARAALFLASEASSFITGQIIVIDGGGSL